MILARKLKLKVSSDQHAILMETLSQYRECTDAVFQYGFQNHMAGCSQSPIRLNLHKVK